MAELTGQTFAGYEILAKLGQGGMGAVYKARQPVLNRIVALKVMAPHLSQDPDYVARFLREASSAAKLNHTNMVLVHTAGQSDGVYYIAMEFVDGLSLQEHIANRGRLDPREAVATAVYIAQALRYAWDKAQIIHRDIKPANIFLSNTGEVKVGDLGLAKSVGQSTAGLTQSGVMMGSPHYISPEQARGVKDIDFRADIYSLGCTLYQMLTGRPPYEGDDPMAVIARHVNDPPPAIFAALPGCPVPLGMLVGKMLAKRRADRPQSYEELIEELFAVHDKLKTSSAQATVALPQRAADVAAPAASPAPAKPQRAVVSKPLAAVASEAKAGTRDSKSVIRNSRFVMGGAVAAAALLVAGLLWWSPWKRSSTRITNYASRITDAASALKLLGNCYTNAVGAEMVYIPPGEFTLGSTKEEQAWAVANGRKEEEVKREGEAPRKTRIKEGFWLGRTEVTVGQWKQFVKETGYLTDGEKKGESYVPQPGGKPWAPKKGVSWKNPDFGFEMRDDHPVSCISWNDAVAFCDWLTERERKAGRLPAGMAARLPTEAEWEYACRAGTQTKWWWGENKEGGKGRLNWAGKDDGYEFVSQADSFGERGRNGFGLADMLGNVWEWCLDEYDATQAHEDLWTGNPGARVLRGGAFDNNPAYCRCAFRNGLNPSRSFSYYGFRVAVGVDVSRAESSAPSGSSAAVPREGGILAPPETRVTALTTNPKVGEVFTLPLGGNVTMELMGIPPGEFLMGSTKEEQAWAVANGLKEESAKREGEAPRKATIKQGFWLGRTEVTVGQWKQFVAATGYQSQSEKFGQAWCYDKAIKTYTNMVGKSWMDPNFGATPKESHPVSCISWNDAVAFCGWLTAQERKAGRLGAGQVVRLPKEAEWEYACRAGSQTKFWWGDSPEEGKDRLNWGGTADGFQWVSPVDQYGERGRNGFGLADMLGNVYEWCLDEYDAKQAHEECYQGNPDARALRGGSFYVTPAYCRCANRTSSNPSYSPSTHGFRVVVGSVR